MYKASTHKTIPLHPSAGILSEQEITNGGEIEKKGTLTHCWWECKLVYPQWRTVWRSLQNLTIGLPDTIIPL